MKTKKLLPVLFAVLALVISILACNFGGEPGASNFYMATDESGETKTTVYSSTDEFFVFFDVSAIEPGTQFEARWYILDYEGEDPNSPFETINYAYEEGTSQIYFQLTSDSEWPASRYRVEVFMNDAKAGEQQFTVE